MLHTLPLQIQMLHIAVFMALESSLLSRLWNFTWEVVSIDAVEIYLFLENLRFKAPVLKTSEASSLLLLAIFFSSLWQGK